MVLSSSAGLSSICSTFLVAVGRHRSARSIGATSLHACVEAYVLVSWSLWPRLSCVNRISCVGYVGLLACVGGLNHVSRPGHADRLFACVRSSVSHFIAASQGSNFRHFSPGYPIPCAVILSFIYLPRCGTGPIGTFLPTSKPCGATLQPRSASQSAIQFLRGARGTLQKWEMSTQHRDLALSRGPTFLGLSTT